MEEEECSVCFETHHLIKWSNPECIHGFCRRCTRRIHRDHDPKCPMCRRAWVDDPSPNYFFKIEYIFIFMVAICVTYITLQMHIYISTPLLEIRIGFKENMTNFLWRGK